MDSDRPAGFEKLVVGYAGLTHLGLCSSVGVASRGVAVVGYSPDEDAVRRIAAGALPVVEPGLAEAFAKSQGKLSFTSTPSGLAPCDLVYVAVDVPTDDGGQSDLSAIAEMLDMVSPHLKASAILVVLSQVPPGFTRKISFDKHRLFYQVETLIFGRALERVARPERFIVGCANPNAALPGSYTSFLSSFCCPILRMQYESAELAKMAINCFLAASVSTTNTLADLAGSLGADWVEIAPALRLDARIGPNAYLTPGLGLAGGNLERDLSTVMRLSEREGTSSAVISAYVDNSRHMKDWAFRILKRHVLDKTISPQLGVLGLAYKQDTHSTKNSPSLALIGRLPGKTVRVHDPVVPASVVPSAIGASTPEEAVEDADAVLLMTPWQIYRTLDPVALAARMRGCIVIDPYRLLDPVAAGAAGLNLYSIGRPPLIAAKG